MTVAGMSRETPCCFSVIRWGLDVIEVAEQMGNCFGQFSHLKGIIGRDKLTASGLAICYPEMVAMGKAAVDQIDYLEEEGAGLGLPSHDGFGSAAMLTGIIVAHYQATGVWIPSRGYYVRTDGVCVDGYHLGLGGGGCRFGRHCRVCRINQGAFSYVGGLLWGLFPRAL